MNHWPAQKNLAKTIEQNTFAAVDSDLSGMNKVIRFSNNWGL